MKHICLIIHQYANPVRPFAMNFVQSLAWQIRNIGYRVTVISPIAINLSPKEIKVPSHIVEITDKGNPIDVFYPKTLGFGQSHLIFGRSPVGLTIAFMRKAAEKVLLSFKERPDVLYGHFLAPSGVVVAELGKKYGIPSFIACGEAHDTIGQYGRDKMRDVLKNVNGFICVSSALKQYLLENGVSNSDKIIVLPNGFDAARFISLNKKKAREKYGFPQDEIIAVFVGAFNHRKGVLRVCEAIEKANCAKLICAGLVEQTPYGKNLLLSTHLNPDRIPELLCAADFFVLPTLAEGCCNAIVEAIACGLPVISSDLPFNKDILSTDYSILVDPMDVNQLTAAIIKLTSDSELRTRMSLNAMKKSKELTLEERTKRIVEYINEKIKDNV